MTAIETIAVIFAALGIIKIVVIMVNKNFWINKVSLPIYGSKLSSWILGILALVIFYYLVQVFSMVEIFAVMAFTSLLMGASLMAYSSELTSLVKKFAKKKFGTWMWIYMLIWLLLSAWVLYSVLLV